MYSPFDSDCCGNCKHFRPMDGSAASSDGDDSATASEVVEDGEYGRCTRYPPGFFYAKLLNAEHPVVPCDEHCGEHVRGLK